ncbi:MAG: TonB-dependent receptor, partial [Candidatus Accumulibacter sp.]|nr:TonB-dependent receptor [Accumulibacter sp.]
LVNLYADYRLQRDWAIFVRANNIFDKYYETVDNYATAGANVFVGVRYAPK